MISTKIPEALAFHHPGIQGIDTVDGVITSWPKNMPFPTQVEVDTWEYEYKAAQRILSIKAEAQRRIFLIAPATKQANMQRTGLEILQALILSGSLTPAQQAVSNELNAVSAQIDAIRSASNMLETLPPVLQDYANDKYWI